MSARIIDGKAVAAGIRTELRAREARCQISAGVTPGIAAMLVGSNPASLVYLRNKARACEEVGIRFFRSDFPADVDPQQVVDAIHALNKRSDVHGILVQLPLPARF